MSLQEKGPLLLFYERLYLVLTVTGVAAACAWWISEDLPQIYRSQARCYMPLQPDALSLTTEEGNLPSMPKLPTASDTTHDALIGTLKSADLLETVAARIVDRDSETIRKNTDFAVDAFNHIVITAWDRDPLRARDIAGEYLRAFRDKLDSSTKERVRENLLALDDEIDRSNGDVERLRGELLDKMESRGSVDFETEYRELLQRASSLRTDLDQIEVDAEVQRRRGEVLKRLLDDREELELSAISEVINPRIAGLELEIGQAERERARLLTIYRAPHPEVIAQQSLIDVLTSELEVARAEPRVEGSRTFTPDTLRREFERSLSELELLDAALEGRRLQLQDQYDAVQAALEGMPRFKAELEEVEIELRKARETLSNLRSRRSELQFYLARTTSFLMTSEIPVVASVPHLPRVTLNAAVAGALGLVISLLLIVVRTRLSTQREAALW